MFVPSPTKTGYTLRRDYPFLLIFKDQYSLHHPCTTSHSIVTRHHSQWSLPHTQSSSNFPYHLGIANTAARTHKAMTSIWAVSSTLHHRIAGQSWPSRGSASLLEKIEEILIDLQSCRSCKGRLAASLSGGRRVSRLFFESTCCISAGHPTAASHTAKYYRQAVLSLETLWQIQTQNIKYWQSMADERRRRQSQQSLYQHGFASDPSYGQNSQANFGNMRDPLGLPSHSVSGYEYSQTPQYASQQVQGTSYSCQSEYSQHLGRAPSGPQYPSSMMYNDSHLSQTGRHPSLDFQSEPAYSQRQSTAVEVLSNQFGSQQYDVSSVSQPSTIPSSYQSASVHHQGAYGPSADLGQTALAPGYSSDDLALNQGSATDLAQPQAPQDPFAPYHHLRRQVNTLVVQGRIAEARPSLLAMSNMLVDGVERLRERTTSLKSRPSPPKKTVLISLRAQPWWHHGPRGERAREVRSQTEVRG